MFPRLAVASSSVAVASSTELETLPSRGPSRSLKLAPTLLTEVPVRRVSRSMCLWLVAALSIPVLTPLVSAPSEPVRLPSRATAVFMPAPRRPTVTPVILGIRPPPSSLLRVLQTPRQFRVRPDMPVVRPCRVAVAPLVRAFVPPNMSLTLAEIVLKSPDESSNVASSVPASAPMVLARLPTLPPDRPSLPMVPPVSLSMPESRSPESLSRPRVSNASESNAANVDDALASAPVKPFTPPSKPASAVRDPGPLSLLDSREVTPSVASANAVENTLPTRVVMALVFRLATPGVSVPPPLPPQQASAVRLLLVAKNATTWASKLPGTIIVVQHPLDPALLTVLPPAAKA